MNTLKSLHILLNADVQTSATPTKTDQMFAFITPFHTNSLLTRAGVYETLWSQHMLDPKDNMDTMLRYYAMLRYYTKCQSRKRAIILSNIYRILLIVNLVIYTLTTICEPNTMTPAQAVLEIFCSKGPIWVKCLSPKREIIQSNFDRIS